MKKSELKNIIREEIQKLREEKDWLDSKIAAKEEQIKRAGLAHNNPGTSDERKAKIASDISQYRKDLADLKKQKSERRKKK